MYTKFFRILDHCYVITHVDDDILKMPKRARWLTGIDLSVQSLFLMFMVSFYKCVYQMVHVERSFARCILVVTFL